MDDNEIDLMIGRRLLSRVDSTVIVDTFPSGHALFEWLETKGTEGLTDTTVFLIDIYMSSCNGHTVASNIQTFYENSNKKAICYLLSSSIDDSDKRKIMENKNLAGFIAKPITVSWFQDILEKHQDSD